MGMDPLNLTASLFFGTLGTAMFVFGKRSARLVPLGSGLALMAMPCVISSVVILSICGSVAAALPFVIRE